MAIATHTFASHFIMRTGDLPALQKLLGHYVDTKRFALKGEIMENAVGISTKPR